MGKASCQVKFEFPDLLGVFERSFDRIATAIASTVQTQMGMRFESEGAYNGHEKWAPLKMRQGQILSLTGTLRHSISPPIANGKAGPQGFINSSGLPDDMLVEVGTKVIYASTHNEGAIIVPKNKRALRYLNPTTKKFIFSSKSVIPKRNFTDLNSNDREEIEGTLANLLTDIFNEAATS